MNRKNGLALIILGIVVILGIVIAVIMINKGKSTTTTTKSSPSTTKSSPSTTKSSPSTSSPSTSSPSTSSDTSIILFYASWCGYSRKFLPDWEKLVAKYGNTYNMFIADVDDDQYKKLFGEYGVKSMPTIYKTVGSKKTKFTGTRNYTNVAKFIES